MQEDKEEQEKDEDEELEPKFACLSTPRKHLKESRYSPIAQATL